MIYKILYYVFFMLSLISCQKNNSSTQNITVAAQPALTYRGADLSTLPEIESAGTVFYNAAGQAKDALTILQQSGMNLVRLRLWHTPATAHCNLNEVETMAQRIKAAGINWWLDFHYSDTWADPGTQTIPLAWQSLSYNLLLDSVYAYTLQVMNELKAKNCLPLIVQIGNETNSGMLWDKGRVGGSFDTNWPNYAALVNKSIAAIKAVDPGIKIMLHFAGTSGATWFFNNVKTQGIPFDIIGISYYSWWHNRTLTELQTDLDALATTFNKDIFIAETAYPFTLAWNDNTNNVVGSSTTLLTGYAASAEGQLRYLTDLRTTIHNIAGNHGIGFCYWSPDWVAFRGPASTNGSAWENLTLFDFGNKVLPAVSAFAQ
jgi:arabinogalactan endo-1,4-beta-galactosidase